MHDDYRKARAVYNNAFTMYTFIEEVWKRSVDPYFKSAARRLISEIKYQAGEKEE